MPHALRIFTPGGELPFAGHPTVGTAFALASLGRIAPDVRDIVFEEGVGPVPVSIERDADGSVNRCTLTAAQQPDLRRDDRRIARRAAMLGIARSAVQSAPEVWSCGVPFLVVPLADVDAAFGRTAGSRALARTARRAVPRRRSTRWHAPATKSLRVRMFAPGLGVAEDPATGSAAAALAGWLARHAGA